MSEVSWPGWLAASPRLYSYDPPARLSCFLLPASKSNHIPISSYPPHRS